MQEAPATNGKKKRRTLNFWALIIIPILAFIPAYITLFRHDPPSQNIKNINISDSFPKKNQSDDVEKNKQANRVSKTITEKKAPDEDNISGDALIPIQISDQPKDITVICERCLTFNTEPWHLEKSGVFKIHFSIKKDIRNPSPTFLVKFLNNGEYTGEFLYIQALDPNSIVTKKF